MKTSARAAFALSLMFSAVLFACLAVAANVKQRPQKSSTALVKTVAAERARAKRAAKSAPHAAAPACGFSIRKWICWAEAWTTPAIFTATPRDINSDLSVPPSKSIRHKC